MVDIDEVRRRNPIQDIVAAAGIELRQTGRGWMACCPFHDDTTASMSVAGIPDRYHCFGCGASGDVIDFIARTHGLGFRDAIAHLEGTGTERMPLRSLPRAGSARRETETQTGLLIDPSRAFEVNAHAWQWFSRPVAHEHAVDYLRRHWSIDLRQAERETGMTFIGHTGHGWTNLVDHLRSHGVSDEELLALDLCQRSRQGNLIDTLRDRLIIPVTDQLGRITGFVGRDTSGHPRAPKYRNPTRTAVFDKATCLYRPTRSSMPDATVIIVEGPIDALAITTAATAAGIAEQLAPVSTLGTAVSPAQARQVLTTSTQPPVIALDGDTAGHQGTLRWVNALCQQGGRVALVADLPTGCDPADIVTRHGADGLATLDPAQRHTNHTGTGVPPGPHLPGRELAQIACQTAQPVASAISAIRQIYSQLNPRAQDALTSACIGEMTRQGWNPDRTFTRALTRTLTSTRPPPIRAIGARGHAPELP
ncbi:CHC2 zinc finger domain-containing protein [Intrasporangium mesophilum]